MCLILLAVDMHPDYPLILTANRDEFYARPSRPLCWWPEEPQLLGGKDLESGGSWFGLTRSGFLAGVTNYREAGVKQPQRSSRGNLVRDYLRQRPEGWEDWLNANSQTFNGFNLLYGKWNQLKWYSNRFGSAASLQTGIHGLSNHLLNTPWPKVERGKKLLKQALEQRDLAASTLLEVLQDDHLAADDMLPDTGIGLEWERLLSPIFIRSQTYGTRASTVLSINQKQQVQFIERNWLPSGDSFDRKVEFDIEEPD